MGVGGMPTFPHWKKLDPLWNLGKCTYFFRGGGGGGGGPGPTARKQSGQCFFVFFSSPQLICLQRGSNMATYFTVYRGFQWFYYSKNCFSKDPVVGGGGGGQHFSGGGGGSKC